MDEIRLKNLRNLEDTNFIKIKPITLLLGSNSSGKSTFLRSFPLIKQSVTTRTTGPILWYGDLVDFGSFKEALSNKLSNIENPEICFAYRFRLLKSYDDVEPNPAYYRLSRTVRIIEDIDITIDVKITSEEKRRRSTICRKIFLSIADHTVDIEIGANEELIRFDVNGRDILSKDINLKVERLGRFLPQILRIKDEGENDDISYYQLISTYTRHRASLALESLVEAIKPLVHHSTKQRKIIYLIRNFGFGSSKKMLLDVQKSRGGKIWSKKTEKWDENNCEFQYIKDLIVANHLSNILTFCDEYISNFARNVSYIGPIRATAERYYRSQDLAVNEVDFQGKNLAMFLRNLSDTEKKNFSNWTSDLFGFSVLARFSGGHVSLRIKEEGLDAEINLADTGFGFSQILPILTQLWWLSKKPKGIRSRYPITFAIEQPELHLHPKLQAILADSFITAIKSAKESGMDLRLIIETHSETIINRLGQRIARNECDQKDVNLVLFDKKDFDDAVKIRAASYDEEGFLMNWPLGFFEPTML